MTKLASNMAKLMPRMTELAQVGHAKCN
jgi:hypothetical protein